MSSDEPSLRERVIVAIAQATFDAVIGVEQQFREELARGSIVDLAAMVSTGLQAAAVYLGAAMTCAPETWDDSKLTPQIQRAAEKLVVETSGLPLAVAVALTIQRFSQFHQAAGPQMFEERGGRFYLKGFPWKEGSLDEQG